MVIAKLNRSSSEVLLQECSEIEEELAALKVAYEQYFMGMERFAPTKVHDALKKRINKLRTSLKGSTAAKFRTQTLIGKFQTYERLWERTIHEIENGIYRRDVYKLKRKQGVDTQRKPKSVQSEEIDSSIGEADDLESAMAAAVKAVSAPPRTTSGSIPAVAPLVPPVASMQRTASGSAIPAVAPVVPPVGAARPGAPVSRAPAPGPAAPGAAGPRPAAPMAARPGAPMAARPAAPGGPGAAPGRPGLEDGKLRAVYDAYVTAKKQCREDTSKLSYESVAENLRKQVPALMKQHNANSVDFKVVIKDGKAVLRAIPK